ncbi:MAG: Hsp70 family protein, partial [Chloroflexota bacterium]|nr:Hsp70 family protein [Chloroflexota bacterium]
ITASSLLSNDEVDRMVKEAQEHAVEDKAKREAVEARNQADALAFQAERTISELGDKVSTEDKAAVESRIEAVRAALKSDDDEAVKNTAAELTTTLQEVATKAYQAAGPEAAPDMGADGDASAEAESDTADDGEEAVEGEFKEV